MAGTSVTEATPLPSHVPFAVTLMLPLGATSTLLAAGLEVLDAGGPDVETNASRKPRMSTVMPLPNHQTQGFRNQ